jgi:hypothetical protein
MTDVASGSIPDSISPRPMASSIVARPPAMESSESRSVGKGPDGGRAPAPPGRIGTPQDRQTWAHEGFERPQLKHSTLSPVMATQPSRNARPGGTDDARSVGMEALQRVCLQYPHVVRWAWAALFVVLAACNNGSDGGGGGDGGPAY